MIKSLQGFWGDVKSSFYNPAFYALVPTKNTGNAVLFLLCVSFVSSLLLVVYLSIAGLAAFSSFSTTDLVQKIYPADLVVTIKDGIASSNQAEPYTIPLDENMKDKDTPYANLLVIDTRPDVTLETLNSYDSFVVLTKDKIFANADDTEGRVMPLASIKDFTVSKTLAEEWFKTLLNLLWLLALPIALFAIVFIAVFSLVFHLIASLLGALLVMLVAGIRKVKLEYGDAYKIALYASAPIIAIQTVAMFFGMPTLPFFLDVLIFIVILFANLIPNTQAST